MSAVRSLINQILHADANDDWDVVEGDVYMAADLEVTRALDDVLERRRMQDAKWGEQNHNPYIYLAILVEEVGELAQAILQTQFGGDKGGWILIRHEAVDVAAVGLALLECLDRDKWVSNDVELADR